MRLPRALRGGPVYVRIAAGRLGVRDTSTGREWNDVPELAVRKPKGVIVAVGGGARRAAAKEPGDIEVVNPFDHPRTALSSFTVAERLLAYVVRELFPSKLLRPAPIMHMHPLEHVEGGLTEIEERALRELAAAAGARSSLVWVGRELRDEEVGLADFDIRP